MADGTAASTRGQARIRVSCPFRGISLDTHATTGTPSRPSLFRTCSPPQSGKNRSVSTPGVSRRIRRTAAGDRAGAICSAHQDDTVVTVSAASPIRRSA
jgi:hypothetical protein